ncbi:MAG: cytochrome c oxidase assembly protein [Gallionellales bacterium RIFCSPLOWO2_02_FULL_59_110]|nr:MAG: cytochrome c oxidase assembly protein [Gallionellales bacterium RIFCSPLOWO2_02_FULL_59_110]OGT04099.1 MAG: cytochrome c oxidase assembly protein [Gallionellales bacterium RIFCSPLOWO2_02_58_13]
MDEALRQANRRLTIKLLLMVAAATGFAFALVPFYDLLCKVTGLNGKTGAAVQIAQAAKIDTARWVTVEFTGAVMPGMSWEFRPAQTRMRVHPGETAKTSYLAKNPTNRTMSGQAVPSVSPGWTAEHFNKIECFCFQRQVLQPGEAREMPLVFFVSPELPADVHEITLSYTLFPVSG